MRAGGWRAGGVVGQSGLMQQDDVPVHVVVMGVAGSGKTTVALELARLLGWPFAEADDFHPEENVVAMSAGVPLTDDDRWPWLATIRDWVTAQTRAGRSSVVTCSALRRAYRDLLREAEGRVLFVHLTVDPGVLVERMSRRVGHFMPPELLPSQLATLEPLCVDEDGLAVSADHPPADVASLVLELLSLDAARGA